MGVKGLIRSGLCLFFHVLFLGLVPAALLVVGYRMLVQHHSEETQDALVALEGDFPLPDDGRICRKLHQVIEPRGFLLNGISQLPKTPMVFVNNAGPFILQKSAILLNRFLHLFIRQNGSHNENGFIVSLHLVQNWVND